MFRHFTRHASTSAAANMKPPRVQPIHRAYSTARGFFAPAFWTMSIVICFNDKFIEIISVDGDSMAPTMSPTYHETGHRDHVMLNKWQPTKDLKRGDVVSFVIPHKPESLGIKRIVALEGDWVDLDKRRRKGMKESQRRLLEEGQIWDAIGEGKEMNAGRTKRIRVPYGHVWVEGDNVDKSYDSNWYGPISKGLIMGKAVCCVYPFSKFGSKPWEDFRTKTKVEEAVDFQPYGWEDLYR